ncbi:peptidoglycan recognition protein family protein [Desulfuribacillus alkaliarsenatis]|uniref:N-acetylmuramoyl-L-alanine amidase n=1 Tax=Desulfuribacillus alkaliarsenatis TaxID=766136 RepID=A0A1E5G108_9FIRM|nr:N-acetylmuramoyl-L-alanine amidase [Desulfuribacillus alkaliarsenatis]OEF96596.1 hypothetical protein BHF68_08095 [Desulfuribacillus alkaliarsenatis]
MYEYIVKHIPKSQSKRPGIETTMESITVHNTANPRSTAMDERNWLTNQYNDRSASWHIAIDESQAVEAIPLSEVAWHAGTRQGNYSSIGIEVCESGDQVHVWENAVHLIAELLYKRNWDVDRVKTHKYWSGKNCPRLLLDRWSIFIKDIEAKLEEIESLNNQTNNTDSNSENNQGNNNPPQWKKDGIEYLADNGLLNNKELWLNKIDEPMPVWATMLLLKRIHEDANRG